MGFSLFDSPFISIIDKNENLLYHKYVGRATYMLKAILEEHNMSLYKLEKLSNISHATLSDLANEKTNPNNCSSLLLNKISKTLDISMDDLFARLTYKNLSSIDFDKNFDLFKSNVDQEFKRIKPIGFIKKYANNGEIKRLFDEENTLILLFDCFIGLFLQKDSHAIISRIRYDSKTKTG